MLNKYIFGGEGYEFDECNIRDSIFRTSMGLTLFVASLTTLRLYLELKHIAFN